MGNHGISYRESIRKIYIKAREIDGGKIVAIGLRSRGTQPVKTVKP